MSNCTPHISHYEKNKNFYIHEVGFTFIELLVVISLIGILMSLGIASYSSYNSSQMVHSSASDVATQLASAKSHAISQVIPSSCGSNVVRGYRVDISGGKTYTLSVDCGASPIPLISKTLPSQVTFTGATTVAFAISNGTVSGPTPKTIKVTGYGKTVIITVDQTGNIAVN